MRKLIVRDLHDLPRMIMNRVDEPKVISSGYLFLLGGDTSFIPSLKQTPLIPYGNILSPLYILNVHEFIFPVVEGRKFV